MGSFSIWHWMIVLVIVLLLFGRGKISEVMGDVAKGVKSFKRGLADEEEQVASGKRIDHSPAEAVVTANE
jgi:sec-independent protein translocase protein TatA